MYFLFVKPDELKALLLFGCPTGVEPVLSVPQTDVITVIPRTPYINLPPVTPLGIEPRSRA